jgi:C-terminal processing protease CtpA/Prc
MENEIKTIVLDNYEWREGLSKSSEFCSDRLCLKIDSAESLGILSIRTFNYYDDDFKVFKDFIDSSFAEINSHGIEHLAIDLRGNGGGDSKCGSYLIEHFADKSYCYWPSNENATWQSDLHATIQPNANRFVGKPYVLIDGGCFSTAGHVCSIIKEQQLGILVGEEAGSTYTCNDSSIHGSFKHTSLTYRIPRVTFKTCATSFPKNRGVLPDVEVLETLNDVIEQLDPVIEYVLEQIRLN